MRELNRNQFYFLIFLLTFPQQGFPLNSMNNIDHPTDLDPNPNTQIEISSEEGQDGDYETTTMQNDEGNIEEYFEIPTDSRLRLCGHTDMCPDLEKVRENKTGYVPGQEKLTEDFKRNPFSCRCDVELCSIYGDCCVGLKVPVTPFLMNQSILLSRKSNPWHCHQLQRQSPPTWALMVSECPSETEEFQARQLCEGRVNEIPPERYNYLVDLPAYSNTTQTLYKNIFCAICHGESNSNMIKWTMKLYCNHEFTPLDRPLFLDNATYIPIEREWRKSNKTCKLIISELESSQIETYIPNVRYCGYRSKADHCPRSPTPAPSEQNGSTNQTNAPELPDGDDSINYEHLCSSYTQFVFDRTTSIQFKNPHCAMCNGVKDVKNLKCVRFVPAPDIRVLTPGESGATLHGVGLNFLFDFGVSEGNNYVGYNMLCTENEIWDYVRQKCHPLMCGQDHVLKDGHCVPRVLTPSPIEGGDMLGTGVSNLTQPSSFPTDCYRILLYPHEFDLLDNQSIAVNRSNNEIIILDPGDYEVVNDTMASICAKYLHEAFPARFSPILDYLTIVSLGLSVTLSFLHMLLFAMLPKLRNLPAKNLFCLTLCLFISQLSFLTLIRRNAGGLCIAAAIIMHFFFLAAFFWMNVLSFDIWRTFSSMMKARQGIRGSRGRTFVKYNLFAWSIPFIIVTVAVLTDFIVLDTDQDNDDDSESDSSTLISRIKPSYGENGLCWISQRLSLFVFFAIPVFLVVLVNLILFSRTAVAILAQQKESSKVFRGEHSRQHSSTSSDEARLKLYIKLALIMGLTWILGFVAAFLSSDWLWYPFVILNGLQGTFIFFSFDFKWRIFKMCTEIFTPLKPIMRGRGSTSSTTNTNVVTLSTNDQRSRNRISVISNSSAVNI